MKKQLLALIGIIVFGVSCAPSTFFIREPTGQNETLIIGRILFKCELTRPGSIPIGKYTYNVKLEFEEMSTGRILKIRTVDIGGFFSIHNPQGRRYRLIRLAYAQGYAQPDYHKKMSTKQFIKETSRVAKTSMRPNRPPVFTIQQGKVNNLGRIVWRGRMSTRKHHYTYNQEYDETRSAFVKRYPDSLWAREEWTDIHGES